MTDLWYSGFCCLESGHWPYHWHQITWVWPQFPQWPLAYPNSGTRGLSSHPVSPTVDLGSGRHRLCFRPSLWFSPGSMPSLIFSHTSLLPLTELSSQDSLHISNSGSPYKPLLVPSASLEDTCGVFPVTWPMGPLWLCSQGMLECFFLTNGTVILFSSLWRLQLVLRFWGPTWSCKHKKK